MIPQNPQKSKRKTITFQQNSKLRPNRKNPKGQPSPRMSAGRPQRDIASRICSLEKAGRAAHRLLARVLRRSKKGAPHDAEEKRLVGDLHRWVIPPHTAQNGGGYLGGGVELFTGNIEQQLRFHIVLQKERKRTTVCGALGRGQTLGHFLLDQHGDGFQTGCLKERVRTGVVML